MGPEPLSMPRTWPQEYTKLLQRYVAAPADRALEEGTQLAHALAAERAVLKGLMTIHDEAWKGLAAGGTCDVQDRARAFLERFVEAYSASCADLPIAAGHVCRIAGLAEDITERRNAEQSLRLQHELSLSLAATSGWREALEHVLVAACRVEGVDCGGVYIADEATGALELTVHRNISGEFAETFARIAADSAHAGLVEAGDPVYVCAAVAPFDRAALAREGLRFAALIPVRYGARLVACLSLGSRGLEPFSPGARATLETMAAQLGGVVARTRASAALEATEANFRTLTENIAAAVAIVRGERVEYANSTMEVLSGYTQAELLGMDFWRLAHPDFQHLVRERGAARLRGESVPGRYEIKACMKDGQERWADLSVSVVEYQGGPVLLATVFDITARKRAEAALRHSKDFLDRIIDCIGDPVFVKDQDHRMVLVNDAECALTGHPRAEVIGKTDHEFFPRAQVDVFWEKDAAVFETGQENINEEALTDANGHVHTIVTKKTLYTDPAGKKFLVGVIRDITERKRIEEALRTSEANFRLLAETIEVAVAITSGDEIVYVNAAAERMLGYSRQELLAMDFWNVVHPDQQSLVRERGAARERGEAVPARYELKFLTKQGEVRWADFSAARFDYSGTPAVLATGFDITARKHAEEGLRTARERLELALRGADLSLWDWNVVTGDAVFDDRWDVMLGYAPGELARRYVTWETRVHPDDLPGTKRVLQDHLEGRTPFYEAEYRLRTRTGQWKWIVARGQVTARGPRGEPIRCTGTHLDVTDRRRAEEAARQHQEQLARVARVSTLGEMASGWAHELAQPLSAILYYARGCEARLRAGAWGAKEAEEAIQKIAAQADRASEFIRRLKAFVRNAQMERRPADVNAIVHRALGFAGGAARVNDVTIDLDLAADLPLVVVDDVQIEQVILNLVHNAIESLSVLRGAARLLAIRTFGGPPQRVSVIVEDSGPGVPAGLEQRVFDAFYTTKPSGTGLGLTISRSIIEAHEGTLWVEARPGGGARFGFALPVASNA